MSMRSLGAGATQGRGRGGLALGASGFECPLIARSFKGTSAIDPHSERNLICTNGVSRPEMVCSVGKICVSASFQLVMAVGGT